MFSGAQYRALAIETESDFIPGVAIGPTSTLHGSREGRGFELSAGGVVIPISPNSYAEVIEPESGPCIPVRESRYLDENGAFRVSRHIDSISFKESEQTGVVATTPCEEESTAYFEVWTGEIYEEERVYQLL